MDTSTILGLVGFGISVIGIIIGAINHTKIKSNCLGFKGEITLDIDKTIPSPTDNDLPSSLRVKLPQSPKN